MLLFRVSVNTIMEKSKKLLKKVTVMAMTGVLLLGNIMSENAAYYDNYKLSWKGYSAVGLNVVTETLHASGYSYSSSGSVTDVWLTTDRCYIFNEVTDEKTWTSKHPNGEYAKVSFKVKIGVPSPWGTIGTSGTTRTLSILF